MIYLPNYKYLILTYTIEWYRIKLDSSSEIEESASSTEVVAAPPVATNIKTQAAFVNKLYK